LVAGDRWFELVIVTQVPAQVVGGSEELAAPSTCDNAHPSMVRAKVASIPESKPRTFGTCPYRSLMNSEAPDSGPGEGQELRQHRDPAAPFQRRVLRLPDGRRLTLYSRPADVACREAR
jgi:hypothetical protein